MVVLYRNKTGGIFEWEDIDDQREYLENLVDPKKPLPVDRKKQQWEGAILKAIASAPEPAQVLIKQLLGQKNPETGERIIQSASDALNSKWFDGLSYPEVEGDCSTMLKSLGLMRESLKTFMDDPENKVNKECRNFNSNYMKHLRQEVVDEIERIRGCLPARVAVTP